MKIYIKSVIVIRDRMVETNHVVMGHDKQKVDYNAEQVFLETCSQTFSNWCDYTGDDITKVVEQGYEHGHNVDVFLSETTSDDLLEK